MGEIEHPAIQRVVLDSGPIIHLDEINNLHLLSDFNRLLVPDAVWREIEYHRPLALKSPDVTFEKIAVLQNKDNFLSMICNLVDLDAGELAAINLCYQQSDSILLTDDGAARLAAKSLAIRAYGTIGVLLRAIRRNQLTPVEVIRILEEIPMKSTLFIKNSLLEEIIEKIKK